MKPATTLIALGIMALAVSAAAQPPIPLNYRISSFAPELQNEEQIWTCPTDSTVIIAVWRDFRLGYRQVGIGRSWLANDFWIDSLIHPSMQVLSRQSDPCLTVDNDGNFYLCVLDYEPSATTIWDSSYISVLRSTDKGVSWTGPVTLVDTVGPYFEDKQFTVVDRTNGPHSGNYYVAWARFPNP
ncbi:MAG: glycoside hydrolase, partial [candidate division Zixibacteria bacterium]|nr:glycoside hydrolase [candidate division Zixibacteria bacterium]